MVDEGRKVSKVSPLLMESVVEAVYVFGSRDKRFGRRREKKTYRQWSKDPGPSPRNRGGGRAKACRRDDVGRSKQNVQPGTGHT